MCCVLCGLNTGRGGLYRRNLHTAFGCHAYSYSNACSYLHSDTLSYSRADADTHSYAYSRTDTFPNSDAHVHT